MHYLDYNEQIARELRNVPLSYHYINKNHPFYRMPLHWHKACEIVRIIDGTLSVYMDDDVIMAQTDDIVFVNQEIIHGYSPEHCSYEVIDFDIHIILSRTSLCKNILHVFANSKIQVLPFHPIKNADLYDITNRLFRLASQEIGEKDLLLLSTLYELLGSIYYQHHYTEILRVTKNASRFKPLLDFIDSSFMNSITTAEMAAISGMSINYFGKSFRKYFGQTPIEFLNQYRLERAHVLLINSTASITDIANSCGFYDASYFVKAFKKYKGMTPKNYRRAYALPPTNSL